MCKLLGFAIAASRSTSWAFLTPSAAEPTLAAVQPNCELNRAVTMSELSLCGESDWAEVMVAASPECSFAKYRFVMGVYDCASGQAVPRFWKRMPKKLAELAYGASDADGRPGFMTLARFRKVGERGRAVDVEVRSSRPHATPCTSQHTRLHARPPTDRPAAPLRIRSSAAPARAGLTVRRHRLGRVLQKAGWSTAL
jgi:hypothetical protein